MSDWKSDWLMVGYPSERKREARALWRAAGSLTIDQAAELFRAERSENDLIAPPAPAKRIDEGTSGGKEDRA